MTVVNVKDLQNGDILEENVYRGNTLMLKKGSFLTLEIISKLKQWNIISVKVSNRQNDSKIINQKTNNKDISFISVPSISELKSIFLNNLINVGHEYRYGVALHETNDFQWLKSLFIKFMSNTTIFNLMKNLRDWDDYSYLHSFDVFILGSVFAKKLGIDNIENLAVGFLLHDIGKLYIPHHVLKKPAKLTPKEYELIKNHTIFGYKILKQHNFSEDIAIMAKYHHERANGSGYPEGLKNNDIQEIVKILSIVDVYSALTLDRPYRKAYGSATAEKILINECKMVGNYYFYNFFKILDIFPLNTLVELTNGIQARIVSINDKIPTYPTFKETNSNQFEIPLNRSVKVKKVIEF